VYRISEPSSALSGLTPATTYGLTVGARDAAGNSSSASSVLSVTTLTVGGGGGGGGGGGVNTSLFINVGGAATGDFIADADFSGGTTYSSTGTIDTSALASPVPPQAVFQSERYGEFTYTIPSLTAGSLYTVTLYFAETYLTAAGQRTFNVAINGSTVLTAFDIFSAASGANKGVAQSFIATASSAGQIAIQFTSGGGTENPKVCGIGVVSGASYPTYLAAPTNLKGQSDGKSVTLSWNATSGATSYVIERDSTQIGTSNTASYTDSTVTAGKTYSYRVRAKNPNTASDASSAVSVTVNQNTGTCPTALPTLLGSSETSFYASANVPHGTITVVSPDSSGKTMRVYTPPGYSTNTTTTYPVLYINHGGSESDIQWACTNASNCGYAGLILDNLIAAGKAVPMILAMPYTGDCASLDSPSPSADDTCTTHYRQSFIPYIEAHYRVKADRNYRGIAGLSMGGMVTLNTGLPHLDIFSQLYVYSAGYIGNARAVWESNLSSVLNNSAKTNGLLNSPIYLGAGDSDIALDNAKYTYGVFQNRGIKSMYQQSSGSHEWMNWRRYFHQTAQIMFTNTSGCAN
jgi:enterochelin esterase-like enzyme